MKIFTIFKCLIRFLNLLFTILKFFRQCYVGDVANKASSDAGPELAGRESHEAMESPKSVMCHLKMGLAGLTSRHQTIGRVRVFATANTWRTQRPRGASGFGTESQ